MKHLLPILALTGLSAPALAGGLLSNAGMILAPAAPEAAASGVGEGLTLTPATMTEQPAGNPADAASKPTTPAYNGEGPPRLRTWEMPALKVEGRPESSLREEDPIGSYNQPRWTATRRFPSTRIYVMPEGAIEIEAWYRPTFNRDGTTETRMLGEIEVGLPNRFQLDVYFRADQAEAGSEVLYGQQIELRWALANWGEIWGNPTLYFEYINLEDRPDKIEPKLLLGGEIAEGWHWGANFVAELEIDGPELEHEYEFTSGVSRTIVDDVFSIGGEFKFSLIDVKGDRGNFDVPVLLGPTFQWRPLPPLTLNLEALVGIGGDSPYGQITFNAGWEF